MKKFSTYAALVTLSMLFGSCQREDTIPVQSQSNESANLPTFVLKSPADGRLPAPDVEDRFATDAERKLIRDMIEDNERNPPPFSPGSPVTYWNNTTANLGAERALPPPSLSRAYALVHVAIYDALAARHGRGRHDLFDNAVIAGAAAKVLLFLFPHDSEHVYLGLRIQLQPDREISAEKILRSWVLGRMVGELIVERGKGDGFDAVYSGTPPLGEGIWTGNNPTLPMAGTWKTWILSSGTELQPEPPYQFGSRADSVDLQEVYDSSLHRTEEQIEIVHKWADFPPPIIWNNMLRWRIDAQQMNALSSARAYAFLNIAMYDAFVSCWATKYTYWIARPFQRIPDITTVVTTPNFPSYTSGHSTISATAAEVMGEIFPSEIEYFRGEAREAAMSRLLAGIHFRHDNEQGLLVGTKIGKRVVRAMRDFRPKP